MSITASYTLSEEIANAISHGFGALLSVAGLTLLLNHAMLLQDSSKIIGFSIYGSCLILLFLCSTLYHALSNVRAKRIFKMLDHCAIFFLIAGTYTPLLLVTLKGSLGYGMLALIWSIALGGVFFKLIFGHKYQPLLLSSYVGMGLLSLVVINRLQQGFAPAGLQLLAIGGAIYIFGIFFYLQKNIPFNHAIWHLFVLGGASCHYFMMFYI